MLAALVPQHGRAGSIRFGGFLRLSVQHRLLGYAQLDVAAELRHGRPIGVHDRD